MMADANSVTFSGLSGLEARTVAVFCVGLDLGDYVVAADGTVTVPFGSDPDALFTIARIVGADAGSQPAYWGPLSTKIDVFTDALGTVTYTVPCAIGFPYSSRGQVVRPLAENEIKSQRGSGLGKMRRVHQVGVLLDSTVGISFGTDFGAMTGATLRSSAGVPLNHATMFSDIYQDTIVDESSFDGMVAWEITRPYPAVVVSLTGFMNTEEP